MDYWVERVDDTTGGTYFYNQNTWSEEIKCGALLR